MANRSRRQRLKQLACALGWLSSGGMASWQPVSTFAGNQASGRAAQVAGNAACTGKSQAAHWHRLADQIIAAIKPTVFPARTLSITAFGAQTGRDCTQAIRDAIARCHALGGGRVRVPAGVWLTGPIQLKSNVNLHLDIDAVLSFVTEPARYLPAVKTRWEGVELMGYCPLIYAHEQENIAVTGAGVIDGNASLQAWWPWKGQWKTTPWPVDEQINQKHSREQLFAMAERGVPVAERVLAPNYLRPPLLQFYQCKRVLVENVTLKNSPFWLIHPVLSEDVIVRGVTAHSHGPNSDGCNPESCRRVLIERCTFDTGDDCIALKSGRNADGRRLNQPVQHVVIQDCEMRAGHGGVVIGSEISGGARYIIARRCRFDSPNLERGLRVKTNSVRGGDVADIALLDSHIGTVKDAIVINLYYEEGDSGNHLPNIRDIVVENLRCDKAQRAFELRGLTRAPIRNLQLYNVHFADAERGVIEQLETAVFDCVSINGKAVAA